MISLLDKNNKLSEHKNSLTITYPRTVNIIFGNYPYPDALHNFIIEIKNNIDPKLENYTNVQGGMTWWTHFLDKPIFNDFINYIINKHQTTHADVFEYFYEKNVINDGWGNEIKKGDSLNFHAHPAYHGILYLTKGCDLILRELNIKITPEPGDYYIFPPFIDHGFYKHTEEQKRYSLIFNFDQSNRDKFKEKKKNGKNS